MPLTIGCAALVGVVAVQPTTVRAQGEARYRIETITDRNGSLQERFDESQLALLEKLNRADVGHLERLRELVVPDGWSDELSYTVLPMRYASIEAWPTFLVVYLPGQLFGAYEFGTLVRWGPVSSGSRNNPTSAGTFALNWRSTGHASTVDPDWFLRRGLQFPQPRRSGVPCVPRCPDTLPVTAAFACSNGTPSGSLNGDGPGCSIPAERGCCRRGHLCSSSGVTISLRPPPWRSLTWLSSTVELPSTSITDVEDR